MPYKPLPFDEASAFFRQKTRMPTKAWDDLKGGMHARAFVVAGAMKDSLLVDFQTAIDKAISSGTTLNDFRKDFDSIVKRHGWNYNGSRGWRSKMIYQTNVSTAYQAGRYKQMLSPAVVKERPYHQYVHGGSKDPRPDHLAYDGLVLPYDDPFWKTHRPKNGWGCKCSIRTLSKGDLKRIGKEAPDVSPTIEIDKSTGIAKGLDKGWDYDPAFTAWGQPLSDSAMATWRTQGHKAWESLTPGNWETEGLKKILPFKATVTKRLANATTIGEFEGKLKGVLNGVEKVFKLPNDSRILVNAKSLSQHVDLNRSGYASYIPELLENPDEIWMSFQRHKGTGKILLRQRIVKALEIEKGRYLLMVAQSQGGMFEAWTIIPTKRPGYINGQRHGKLVWKAE